MMKFVLIAAASILSTLASGFALPDLTPRATVIRPELAIAVKEDSPDTPVPSTNIAEASRTNGAHTVETFFCFVLPTCTGSCTISFSDAISATGRRTLQLFSTSTCPVERGSWNTRPFLDVHKGTFLVPPTATGPATVVEDFGLTFPCPMTTTNYGFAVIPVGDEDYLTWDITKGGLIITCN